MTYRLNKGVCFRQVGDDVFVRNVVTRFDYLFNPIVKFIFEQLESETTREELLTAIAGEYDVSSDPAFGTKLDKFLADMCQKEILIHSQPLNADRRIPKDAEGCSRSYYQRRHQLWNASFELTYNCNEKCRHCYLDDDAENKNIGIIGFDVYRRVIDEIAAMGCMNVLVTGGEPTLHPDFIKICECLSEKRILIDIFTNGLNIPAEMFDAIVALRPNTVSFSLYGGTAAFHDNITQVPGSFDRSLRNLLMLKCAGVEVYIKSVLFKGANSEQRALRTLAARIDVPVVCGETIANGHSGRVQETLEPDKETLMDYLADEAKIDPFWHRDKPIGRKLDDPICNVGYSTIAIRPNGDISPCIKFQRVIGNVRHDSLKAIWENSAELSKFRQMRFRDVSKECATCPNVDFCHVCPAVAFSEHGSLTPCNYSCRQAAWKKEFFESCRQTKNKRSKNEKES